MIKMVVFDMAGTTVNEGNVVYKTLREAINEHGFNVTLNEVLEKGAGKEKLQAIKSVLATNGSEDNAIAQEIYKSFVVKLDSAYDQYEILPQENALELFHALKQLQILVVLNTGYNAVTAQSLIDKLGWKIGDDYDQLVTSDDVKNNRPYPDMIWLAMSQAGIDNAKEVVKVGDSIIDIEEGQNAGCSVTVGITTGAHTIDQLRSANPTYIIHNLKELMPLLKQ